MIHAFVLIDAEPSRVADLAQELADIDGIREAHSVAGSDTDLVAVAAVATHEDVATVVTEHIGRLDGVRSTTTLIAFRSYSTHQLDSAYEGFGD